MDARDAVAMAWRPLRIAADRCLAHGHGPWRYSVRSPWDREFRPERGARWLRSLPADTVLFHLDVIGLKGINDRHGLRVGDVVLVEVARRLQAVAKPWPAYRYGGGEFLVFARLPDVEASRSFGHELRMAVDGPVAVPPGAFDPRPLAVAVRVVYACAVPGSDIASLQLDIDAASFGRLDLKPASTGLID